MITKPATAFSLGATILMMTALAQTAPAAGQPIELARAHNTESREACERAGGHYEEGPGYFACIDGRRNPQVPCAERERGADPCSAATPSGKPGLIQRVWSRLKSFRTGR
jgi:hypothetical protein